MAQPKVLITGAAGSIGSCLRAGLEGRYDLRGFDHTAASHGSDAMGDLIDLNALKRAMQGVQVVIHLAATKKEAPFVEDLVPNNIIGLYNVFEAAREAGVRRLVFASSVQTVAGYPKGQTIHVADAPRPSSLYGATKVFGETLGRYYFDQHGMEFVGLRIGWFLPYDAEPLQRGLCNIWLSPHDCVRLFERAIEQPDVGYAVVFGTSITPFERLSLAEARELLGYEPQDDVAQFAIDTAPVQELAMVNSNGSAPE